MKYLNFYLFSMTSDELTVRFQTFKVFRNLKGFFPYQIFCLTFLLFSCTPKEDNQTDSDPDFNNVKVAVNIQRLDKEMFACQSKDDLLGFFDKYPTFINDYFQVSSADFDKLAEQLLPLIQNQGLRDFYKQSQEPAFFGGQTLENEFRTAFQHIKYYYPNFKEPKIYTIFSGFFNQFNLKDPELMVSDSVIYIGLDYFMGKKGKYLPEVYDYQLRKAMPQALVPQAVLLLSQRFNATNPKEKSLLTDMVWYGKSYVFGHTMMPDKADSLFIGYTSEQLAGSYENQESIWAHFIDNQLLYNTQDPVKAKYVGERPTTPEIGKSCPGSIGRWLGWRIVGKYFDENKKITIQELMKMTDAQKVFEASKYKGLPDEE